MTLHQYIDDVSKRLMAGKASSFPVVPDFPPQLVEDLSRHLELTFIPEKLSGRNVCLANAEEVRPEYRTTFSSSDLLNYFYAVLHSPAYREKYKEFQKVDLSRMPYPKVVVAFWRLVELGGQLRQLHLLESPLVNPNTTPFPVDGHNEVSNPQFVPHAIVKRNDEAIFLSVKAGDGEILDASGVGRVYINEVQYFEGVSALAWGYYIGSYQPAQKWLKDREGRKLELDDVLHYQKIIGTLSETERLMEEIQELRINVV